MPPTNPYSPLNGPRPSQPGPDGYGYGPQSPQQPQYPQQPSPGYGVAPNPYGQSRPNGPYSGQAAPPPSQPEVPYFLDPNGPYGPLHPAAPVKKRKPQGKKVAFVVVLALLLLVGGLMVIIAMSGGGGGPSAADQAFQAALTHAYGTSSLKRQVTQGKNSETFSYDVSDPKNPKTNSDVTLADADVSFTGYGDAQSSFVNFKTTQGVGLLDTAQQKWIQARKDGTQPKSDKILDVVSPLIDPQSLLFGDFIYGNFAEGDRQALLSQAQQQHVYGYTSDQVSTGVVGGQPVYIYNVTLNASALKELNKKAAGLFGIDAKAVDSDSSIAKTSAVTVYVSIKDQQFIKTEEKSNDAVMTTAYSGINNTQLSSSPVAELQWTDLTTYGADTPDNTRKSDLGSIAVQLEAYYAKNSHYPTLDNLNDVNWLRTNLPGFSSDKFKDPAGTDSKLVAQPAKNAFAYQFGTDKTLTACTDVTQCKYFKLTATLDDGSQYSKESL